MEWMGCLVGDNHHEGSCRLGYFKVLAVDVGHLCEEYS